MKKEQVLERYSENEYSKKVCEYMHYIVNQLELEYGKIDDAYVLNLDMVAENQELIYSIQKDVKENGLVYVDRDGKFQRNPLMPTLLNLQAANYKLIQSFGLTVMSKCKIKGNTSDLESPDNFIDNLVN